jgi:hypothetical protein
MSIELVAEVDCAAAWRGAVLHALQENSKYWMLASPATDRVLLRLIKNILRENGTEHVTPLCFKQGESRLRFTRQAERIGRVLSNCLS